MHFTKQEQLALIFIIITALIGGGALAVRKFYPVLFMGKPDLVARDESKNYREESQNRIPSEKASVTPDSARPQEEVLVHVTGEVKRPDVYRLEKGMRVLDAIKAAGGATEQADLQRLNLAAKVIDGEQIVVPDKLASSSTLKITTETSPILRKINLNTATIQELENLPNIGPTMAKRIIEYRNIHGHFYNIEEIKEVKGIGEKTFEKIKDLIVVY